MKQVNQWPLPISSLKTQPRVRPLMIMGISIRTALGRQDRRRVPGHRRRAAGALGARGASEQLVAEDPSTASPEAQPSRLTGAGPAGGISCAHARHGVRRARQPALAGRRPAVAQPERTGGVSDLGVTSKTFFVPSFRIYQIQPLIKYRTTRISLLPIVYIRCIFTTAFALKMYELDPGCLHSNLCHHCRAC